MVNNYVCIEKEEKTKEKSEDAYERKLAEALHHMESMGFDNDNGWLKQLLISKDLDIGRVVDALKPPQQWSNVFLTTITCGGGGCGIYCCQFTCIVL